MERKEVILRIKEILKRSTDTHNVYTPFELCEEMINKLPELNSDMNIMVMFNLEFIWTIKEKIRDLKNVWFMTPCELKKKAAIGMGIDQNKVVIYSYNTKQIEGEEKMPKFDVVILNPPYKGKLYIDFLNIAYNISKKYVIAVHPATIYLNQRAVNKRTNELFYYSIFSKIIKIDLFNSIKYFKDINLQAPMSISFFDKEKNNTEVILYNDIFKTTHKINDIKDVHMHDVTSDFISLRNKILLYCKTNNLSQHIRENGKYYVNIPRFRGNTSKTTNKWVADDFYTFFDQNTIVTRKKEKVYFGFKTKKEAENLLNYMKTNFARFSLSIYKIAMSQEGSELSSIPWLDFSQEWTDEKLYNSFELKKEEIEFIEKNIPKYY